MSRRNIFVTLAEPAAIVRRDQKALKREKEKILSCRRDTSALQQILNHPPNQILPDVKRLILWAVETLITIIGIHPRQQVLKRAPHSIRGVSQIFKALKDTQYAH